MIRRDITSPDGTELWLLISQVDHACISGDLVRQWQEPFSWEVVDAITHHDDGWAAWEMEPKLNPKTGAPFSFLEMPLSDALSIWDQSITAAREFGPLAGWMVAGHFYNLLSESDHAKEPPAIAWLTAKRKIRTAWIDEWLRSDPRHILEYAKRAQHMLVTADLFSLWLCCDCPVQRNKESILGKSGLKLRTDGLLSEFHFNVLECTIQRTTQGDRVEALDWTVAVDPYPCSTTPLFLSAKSISVPVSRYPTWQGLTAVSRPIELSWQLVSAAPAAI